MFPDLDLSLVQSFMPSRTKLEDASESALEGMIWLGGIGLTQTKNIFIWTIQTTQALYAIDWNKITRKDFTLENCFQLLSYEVLTGKVQNDYLIHT